MSTHIAAFTPDHDPEFIKHRKVFLTCLDADVSLPPETADYFKEAIRQEGYCEGAIDARLEVELEEGVHYKGWSSDSAEGYEINLKDLPEGVTRLRFYNAW